MKATVKIANVYDGLLNETKKELVITRGRTVFIGPLFFQREEWEKVRRPLRKIEVEGTAQEIMLKAYEMMKEEGMTAKDDKTLKTMLHWQYVNGFSEEMPTEQYGFKNDTEYLASLN